jgi:hypothetical protein
MFVLSLGIPRSASTWLNYAAFGILSQTGEVTHAYGASWAQAEALMAAQTPHVLMKTHRPDGVVMDYVRREGVVLISLRDPRDAVISFLQGFGGVPVSRIREIWDASVASLICRRFPRSRVWRYEDGFADKPRETIAELADVLNVPLSSAAIDALAHDLSRDASIDTGVTGVEVKERENGVVRIQTQWQTSHRGDGRTGKWRESPNAAEVDAILAPMISALGYPDPAPSAAWPPILFNAKPDTANINLDERGIAMTGPSLALMPGKWRIDADLNFEGDPGAGVELYFDVMVGGHPWAAYRTLQSATGPRRITLVFEVPPNYPPYSLTALRLQVATPTPSFTARLDHVAIAAV